GARRVDVVENGVDPAYFRPEAIRREPGRLLFLGSLDWRPNLDGVRPLLHRVFPAVRAAVPSARLCLAGRRPPDVLRRAAAAPGGARAGGGGGALRLGRAGGPDGARLAGLRRRRRQGAAGMNVIHLTASTFYGGPERQILGLCRALEDGARSTVLSFAEAGR